MTEDEFKNCVLPYSRKLYPMLRRVLKNEEEARDALQELMVKLWTKRNELGKCLNLQATYFYILLINLLLQEFRIGYHQFYPGLAGAAL